jgi:hypothetical protein
MKLSDVMSAMNLAAYAEAALVLLCFAFALIAIDLARRGRSLERFARLPLEQRPAEQHDTLETRP